MSLVGKTLTLREATEQHAAVGDAIQAMRPTGDTDPRLALAEQVWNAIVGIGDDRDLATVVAWSIPTDYVPLVRSSDGVAATFAFAAALAMLGPVLNSGDDLAIRAALGKAWEIFRQRKDEADAVEEGFGCDRSLSWRTLRRLAADPRGDEWRKKMIDIARLAGRMFRAMTKVKRPVRSDDPQQVDGATLGDDPERLLSDEIALLSTPETADQVGMRILQRRAQQSKMKGKQNKARGPLVLVVDESGSMHDEGTGRGRNTWAKACAVALTRVAWSEHRAVRCVHFGTACVPQEIPHDDLAALEEMASSFLSGGTDFVRGLRTGYEQVGDLAAAGQTGADVVFVTDGEDGDHQPTRQALNARLDTMDSEGIRLWTVAIGQHHDDAFPLKARAERYVYAHDSELRNERRAIDLAAGLSRAAEANPRDWN
jgi:Mg-chelatase subunit ChlD